MMVSIRLFVGGNLVSIIRNNQWLIDPVRKQSLEPWLVECEMLWLKILWNTLEYDSKDSMTVL